jgi:hypothetical protein
MQLSRSIVLGDLEKTKDVDTAKWYIEKHDDKQPQVQQNTQVNVFANLKDKYSIESETVAESEDGAKEDSKAPRDDSSQGAPEVEKKA